jgi:hypothetical protein
MKLPRGWTSSARQEVQPYRIWRWGCRVASCTRIIIRISVHYVPDEEGKTYLAQDDFPALVVKSEGSHAQAS